MSVTIIGSGLAAYILVREIRRLDKDFPVTVITADNGDYYSKPQLSTALTNHKSADQLVLMPREKFAAQFNIHLIPYTTVESLDDIQSSHVVLATGAKPKIPPNPPRNEYGAGSFSKEGSLGGIFSVNHLEDYRQFRQAIENRRHVTIIGAGLVGCEFANDLCNGGYEVTLIAPEAYPLARLVPEEIGIALKEALAKKGVHWRLKEFFNSPSLRGERSSTKPSSLRPVILSAIGLKPEIRLAQASGIKVNQGIMVDQYLQTSRENIYALGDCMEFEGRLLPYIAPIAIAARALAKTLLGKPTPVIYPPMPIYVKTPAYPIVVLQSDNAEGEWQIEKDQHSIRALFYHQQKLTGFALGGAFAAEAVEWIKKI